MLLELHAGQASFDIARRESRVFEVRAGEVTIKVLGTAFEIERDGARTRVSVSRGRVAVSWRDERTELAAGEAGWFPRANGDARARPGSDKAALVGERSRSGYDGRRAAAHSGEDMSAVRGSGGAAVARAARDGMGSAVLAEGRGRARDHAEPAGDGWHEAAERGDFQRAYGLLARAPAEVPDLVESLLLAADAARFSGHPDAALPFLRQVVSRHPGDSRAPLAAFTLGGVLMQQLGQPHEAEKAYARARELSLHSSLAEDALARQVEACHRAGDAARAHALALEYIGAYPHGRRTHAVQRFGGL
jgi:transmembrane sensor